MKRLALTILFFLLLGTVVNVAVAWAFTFKGRPTTAGSADFLRAHADGPTWFFVPIRQPGAEWMLVSSFPFADVGWQHDAERVPRWSTINERPAATSRMPKGPHVDTFWLDVAHGWPSLSMTGAVELGWRNTGVVDEIVSSRHAFAIRKSQPVLVDGQIIPLRPIWPGFAINTVFYAGILWMVFAAPFALRRRRRIRRGLCPACAYPVGESEVCTECGKPLIKQKAQKQKAEMT